MVEQVPQGAVGVADLDGLPADPFGGEIRLTAADLADCPGQDDELQQVPAGEWADRLLDRWWADPSARRDWDADLARLSDLVMADTRRDATERRTVLHGAPGAAALAAVQEVLDGSFAWTAEQAAADGFVDELQDAAIAGFAAARRLESHALWLQVGLAAKVVTAWTGRTPSLPRKTSSGRLVMDDQDVLVDGAVALEFAVAAGITQNRAHALIDAATALILEAKLPMTAQVLSDGRLDWPRLRMIVSRTRELTVEAAQAVEQLVYATRGVLDGGTGRFDTALTAATLAVDAEAEARRRRRNRKGRRVSIQSTDDGAALFTAVGPGEAITAAYNGLDAAARYLRRHGDPRTLDQLRHDLFLSGCTSGFLPVPAEVLPIPPGCVPDDGRAPAPTSTRTSAATSAASVPDTFLGTARSPGDSGARSARVAAGGGNDHAGSGGSATDAGRVGSGLSENGDDDAAPGWFTTTWPDVQIAVNVTVSAETLMGLVNDPGAVQGYGPIPVDAVRDLVKNGVFRCVVVDGEHGTVLGVGKSTFSPGYVASERLKLLIEHAYPTCTGPNCGKAAWRCDLDHQTPYGQGGATCECNARPLCRACHRLKTAGLLVPAHHHPGDPPGTTLWTTRTGRAYTVLPHAPLPPRSGAQVTPDGATRRRAPAATADEPPPF